MTDLLLDNGDKGSSSNPADVISRGVKGPEKEIMDMWLQGPAVLWNKEEDWPVQRCHLPELSGKDDELKTNVGHPNVIVRVDSFVLRCSPYSSWDSL